MFALGSVKPHVERRKGRARMMLDPLYPIIDRPDWIVRLGRAGARLIQLRMKDLPEAELRVAIRAGLAMAEQAGITLVINDHWRIALDEGARWVHLGQEDLDGADLAALRARGMKLGVSTHDGAELGRALAVRPDYIALGPIFPTTVKENSELTLALCACQEEMSFINEKLMLSETASETMKTKLSELLAEAEMEELPPP